MCSRQQTGLGPERTNLRQLSVVRTNSVIQNHRTNVLFLNVVQNFRNILFSFRENFCEMLFGFLLNRVHVGHAFLLLNSLDSGDHLLGGKFTNGCIDFFRSLEYLVFHLFFAHFGNDFLDEFAQLLDFLVTEHDGVQHFHFRNFVCAGLYHHDRFLCTGNGQIDIGSHSLLVGRVNDQFAVYSADYNSGGRTIPRNIRCCQCNGRAQHCSDFRRAIVIHTPCTCHNHYVVPEALREQRSQRTVNQTGCENCLLARLPLSLDISSRNLSDTIHLLFVITAQREEIDVLSRFLRCSCCAVHYGLTVTNRYLSICLLAYLSDLELQQSSAQCRLKGAIICKSSH